ncbi:T9SS type A sorting domain-containing protein [Aquimarina litoralis]|uniref:T9SS type A sorting domain-containing protein n=1 Tax=Aquimarina litoralis TaxID=584605 RepID=UPI001C58A3C1
MIFCLVSFWNYGQNANPVAICQDITVQLDETGNVVVDAASLDNGSSDPDGDGITLSLSQTSFTCADVNTPVTVTLTVTDGNGGSDSCTAVVTVEDNILPVLECRDITVELDENGRASSNVFVTGAIINRSDNCDVVGSVGVTGPGSFSCNNLGTFQRTIFQDDVNGNRTNCTFVTTIVDLLPPIVACQDITVQLEGNGQVLITATELDAGSTDNCTIDSFALSRDTFGFADLGDNEVTLTVTDISGNAASCTAIVTILADDFPVAQCQDITVQLDEEGAATIAATQVDAGSTDTVGIASLSVTPSSFDCSNIGVNEVTLTVTNTLGNVSTCTAMVTVEDITAPVISCPENIILDCPDVVTYEVAVSDCSFSEIPAALDGFTLLGTFGTSTYFISDQTMTASEVFEKAQEERLDILTINNAEENEFIQTFLTENSINNVMIGLNDQDVEDTFVWQSGQPATFRNFNSGEPNNVGNEDFVSIIASSGLWNDIRGTVSTRFIVEFHDYATGPILINGLASGNFFETGTVSNTFFAKDSSGNIASCSFDITVLNDDLPDAICQDITVQLDQNGQVTINPQDVDGGSSSLCSPIESILLGVGIIQPETAPGLYALAPGFNSPENNLAHYNYDPITDLISIENSNYGDTSLSNTISIDYNPLNGLVYLIADSPESGNRALYLYDLNTNTIIEDLGDIAAANSNAKANALVFGSDGTLYISYGNGEINTLEISTMTTTLLTMAPNNGGGIGLGYDYDSDRLIYSNINDDTSEIDLYDIEITDGTVTPLFSFLQGGEGGCNGTAQALEYVGNGKFVAGTTFGCSEIYTININTQEIQTLLSPDEFVDDIKALLYVSDTVNRIEESVTLDCANLGENFFSLLVTTTNGKIDACYAKVIVEDPSVAQISCPANQTVASDEGTDTYQLPDYFAIGEATATGTCANPLVSFTQNPASGTLLSSGITTVTLCAVDESGTEICCSFELTVDPTLSTEEFEFFNGISIYPNPVVDILHIENSEKTRLHKIEIYDINGRLVKTSSKSGSKGDLQLNVANLENGPYFIRIQGEKGSVMKQLIKR